MKRRLALKKSKKRTKQKADKLFYAYFIALVAFVLVTGALALSR
jgi:hypothetical protein